MLNLLSNRESQDMYTTCEKGQQVGAVNSQILADILKQFFYVVPVQINIGKGEDKMCSSSKLIDVNGVASIYCQFLYDFFSSFVLLFSKYKFQILRVC